MPYTSTLDTIAKSDRKLDAKLQKAAAQLRSALRPSVKISCDGHFTNPWFLSQPSDEHVQRRPGQCDLYTFSIPENTRSWFRVFITNSSDKAVVLCPFHTTLDQCRPLPSVTVHPHEEGEVQRTLFAETSTAHSMQIFGDNKIMLFELRFKGVQTRDVFYPAVEYPEGVSDDDYFSADDGPPTPRPRTPVSGLAIVPRASYYNERRRQNAYNPALHQTDARLERMHALLPRA